MDVVGFVFSVLVGLILLVILVVVHELGHAIAARRNGVVVEEFGIGFPPKAYAKKLKNGVLFTLNWLPIGGFVRLKGEHDAAKKKGDYGAASLWVKTKILLAGVFVNWGVAALLFTILAVFGLPKIIPGQFSLPQDTQIVRDPIMVASVVENSPAEKAGLRVGDMLVRFDGEPLEQPADLNALTSQKRGQTVDVLYNRDGKEFTTEVKLNSVNTDNRGYLGVGSGQREFIRATWSAPIVGVATTVQLTGYTFEALGQMMGNLATALVQKLSIGNEQAQQQAGQKLSEVSQNVAGPIGILAVIFPAAQEAGLTSLVMLTALISLTLAIMNILPIPALDGGRWFTTVLFRLLRKPLTKEIEENINAVGFLILMALVVLVTIADIGKLGQ